MPTAGVESAIASCDRVIDFIMRLENVAINAEHLWNHLGAGVPAEWVPDFIDDVQTSLVDLRVQIVAIRDVLRNED